MLSGICCAAITSIEIANANAASMKVSSRVISIPRNRNPCSRGNASRSAGSADAMSSWRGFISFIMTIRHQLVNSRLHRCRLYPHQTSNLEHQTSPPQRLDSYFSYPRHFTFYVADPISSIETRSLPTLIRSYPRHFTFYLAQPIRSIDTR